MLVYTAAVQGTPLSIAGGFWQIFGSVLMLSMLTGS